MSPIESLPQEHVDLFGKAWSAVLTLLGLTLGWIWNSQRKEIEKLQAVAHSPEACANAAKLVTREEFQKTVDTLVKEAREDRAEVMVELRSLRELLIEGLGSRPTRDEINRTR